MQWCVSDLTGPLDKTGAGLSGSQWHKAMQHVSGRYKSSPGEKGGRQPQGRFNLPASLSDCLGTTNRQAMEERQTQNKRPDKMRRAPAGFWLSFYFKVVSLEEKRRQNYLEFCFGKPLPPPLKWRFVRPQDTPKRCLCPFSLLLLILIIIIWHQWLTWCLSERRGDKREIPILISLQTLTSAKTEQQKKGKRGRKRGDNSKWADRFWSGSPLENNKIFGVWAFKSLNVPRFEKSMLSLS